ncbi:aspartate aminotransferase family protein [Actinomadura rubrisoli]|uniref:Aminotransferase class III-fold pyridoxal phosphate-dependent enzyme n=1 Tax=Actinomadura rubrisoli TaxID=2530368 RepID=A0A4R5C6G4_9ACTN|nr:aminotransferase class III-fold pyridoxal phosphate-dependent enzyme [Actinomadura rubrisoli]TDD95361.1 aminotransferase class III-fold pyridoxal phosphate-dependent enzyme [Actinomadura rubrisoli]
MDDHSRIARIQPDLGEVKARLEHLVRIPAADLEPEALARYERWFEEHCASSRAAGRDAADLIPGGTHHSQANIPFPLQIDRAAGPHLWDADGNRYIDFVQGVGASLLGANNETVREKVKAVLDECGPSLGLLHRYEIALARTVREFMPAVQRLRMTASGTEAAMAAVRVARAYTGAAYVVKLGGAYHGWSDQLAYGLNAPGTARRSAGGIPEQAQALTQEVPPGDVDALRSLLSANAERGGTAAVIVEPLGPQSGTFPFAPDYLEAVQESCRSFGALFVVDEVITGFRLGLGGAHEQLGLSPDLLIFGKCIAGGYPAAGALGGRADVMATIGSGTGASALVVGTLSANPLSCAAGYHSLLEMARTDAPARAASAGALLRAGLERLIAKYQLPYVAYNFGSIVHLHTSGLYQLSVTQPDFASQLATRREAMIHLIEGFTAEGLMLSGSGRMFVGATHTDQVVADALDRFDRVFASVRPVRSSPEPHDRPMNTPSGRIA